MGTDSHPTGGLALRWPVWIGIVCEDLEQQRHFYRDVLGLSELKAGDHWVWFDFGLRRRDARPSLVDRAPTRG